MMFELKIHTGHSEEQADDKQIGSHDFTIYYNGQEVAYEPEPHVSGITWGDVRAAVALLNKLADPAKTEETSGV